MNHQIHEILSGQHSPTLQETEEFDAKYPYCILADIALLKSGAELDDATKRRLISKAAMIFPDRTALFDLIGETAGQYIDFYPVETPVTPSTNDTIDSFLDKFGTPDPKETAALTKMIFNPNPDYASILAAEEKKSMPDAVELDETAVDENTLRINRFINLNKKQPQPVQQPEETTDEPKPETSQEPDRHITPTDTHNHPAASSSLSESFAAIMIKNHNYRKALEIITDLSLNNPKKSVYFADQIRFLRKLIKIENKS